MNVFQNIGAAVGSAGIGAALGGAAIEIAGMSAIGMVGGGAGVGMAAGPAGVAFGAIAGLAVYGAARVAVDVWHSADEAKRHHEEAMYYEWLNEQRRQNGEGEGCPA